MQTKAPPPSNTDKEQDARLDALESAVSALTTRVTALEGRMTDAEQRIAALEDRPVEGSELLLSTGTLRLGGQPSVSVSAQRIMPQLGCLYLGELGDPVEALLLTLATGSLRLGSPGLPVTVTRQPAVGLIEIGL
jgi:hypothetical protein